MHAERGVGCVAPSSRLVIREAGRVSLAGRLGQNGKTMSGNRSNKRLSVGRGPGRTSPPERGARSIRVGSLLVLVFVILIVALLMVVSLVGFVLNPDPALRAGPMYVTLTLTTCAALLMLVLALNATFLPLISRERTRNLQLIMWAMGITGIVTGLLTLGRDASPYVTRLALSGIAFMFITMQNSRLARARQAAQMGQAGPLAPSTQPHAQARARSRQRRGGRKR